MADTTGPICPFMSTPLLMPGSPYDKTTVARLGDSLSVQVVQVPCLREKCTFWAVGDVLDDGTGSPGHCGLCTGGLG